MAERHDFPDDDIGEIEWLLAAAIADYLAVLHSDDAQRLVKIDGYFKIDWVLADWIDGVQHLARRIEGLDAGKDCTRGVRIERLRTIIKEQLNSPLLRAAAKREDQLP